MPDILERAKALTANATRGPWQWFGNTKMTEVYLATVDRGRIFVMDFARWGMSAAQPRFQVRLDPAGDRWGGRMVKLADLDERHGVQMVATHRKEFVGIAHGDATFMAESRQLVDDLVSEVERLRAELEAARADRQSCTGHLVHDEFTACPVHDQRGGR